MPGDGLAHGPPAKRKAGGSHHRFGTTSPSAPTMLVWYRPRVHRSPASRVVTIAKRPQHRGGMAREDHVFL
jgi:hypothetical protein